MTVDLFSVENGQTVTFNYMTSAICNMSRTSINCYFASLSEVHKTSHCVYFLCFMHITRSLQKFPYYEYSAYYLFESEPLVKNEYS